jgi:glycosyltransferase involved in cell wall biosynthesis
MRSDSDLKKMNPDPKSDLHTPDGSRPFVMLDGFNLGLERGTGVATYARNLSFALRDLGCEVGVLYGGEFGSGDDELLKEVSFFDSQVEHFGLLQRLWRAGRAVLRSSHSSAFEVPMTGSVITDGLKSRLPHYDSIWNASHLFVKASARHEAFGSIGRVRFPRAPHIQHWTYPLPLRTKGALNIYTLHDLVPLRLPFTTLDRKKTYLNLMRWIAATADHIVTVSEASRTDIINLLGVSPERVSNTYQSVSIPTAYSQRSEAQVIAELDGIFGLRHRNYFLFFGSIEPKKNIGRIIEAYLSSDIVAPLVIVGAQAWKSDQELRLLGARKEGPVEQLIRTAQRRVVRIEYLPLPMLVSLIRGARAVLFPSLYEGFGLPVLEAMSLGTPVLSSTTSSIPEVAGDAALLVDPYDTQAIAEGIRALDENDALRAELTDRGLKRARLFEPEVYAGRLADVYRRVLSKR